ncbi:MAG TPA: hypothetical protein VMY99_01905 [Nevskiaceae bacterium]|nr:hypothetical protein [Nevskiaceae bacterium]
MKLPDNDRLRRILNRFYPTVDPQAANEDPGVNLTEVNANQTRLTCANRLRPYVGRLVLVNNFRGIHLEENAVRIGRDVLGAEPADDTPLGISAVLSYGRKNHKTLLETANALTVAFEGLTSQRVFSVEPQYESSERWLPALAQTAENTATQSRLPPDGFRCVAVVSALDMNRHMDIPFVPLPGAAFKLTGISEEARFSWQTVSVHPEEKSGLQILEDSLRRMREDPDYPQ